MKTGEILCSFNLLTNNTIPKVLPLVTTKKNYFVRLCILGLRDLMLSSYNMTRRISLSFNLKAISKDEDKKDSEIFITAKDFGNNPNFSFVKEFYIQLPENPFMSFTIPVSVVFKTLGKEKVIGRFEIDLNERISACKEKLDRIIKKYEENLTKLEDIKIDPLSESLQINDQSRIGVYLNLKKSYWKTKNLEYLTKQ